jgi:hypothetical protein
MASVQFRAIPESGPITLAAQQTSPLFELFVPDEAEQMFLRAVALSRDNDPLGGDAPTFQIRAARGVLVSVGPDSGVVTIPDNAGNAVGSVRCQRLPDDVFLLTISDVVENSGPWVFRIKNNDPETLRFLAFSSHHEAATRQPWTVLGDPNAAFGRAVLRFSGDQSASIPVRNWGTAPLVIDEALGTPLGAADSPVFLTARPDNVPLHGLAELTTETRGVGASRQLDHVLLCNDTIEANRRLALRVEAPGPIGPPGPPVPVDPPSTFCRRGCGCQEFLPSGGPGGRCARGICGHSIGDHSPV